MQTVDAQYFWANHPGTERWCEDYAKSSHEPARDWVLDGLRSLPNVTNVLEIGCHCGPLLQRLTEAGFVVGGVDVNPVAVRTARARGFNVVMGTVPDVLTRIPDHSIDALVSSFCLSYIAPKDLVRTLRECLRVARVGVVISEPMAGGSVKNGVLEEGPYVEWRHDYIEAIEQARIAMGGDYKLKTTLTPHDDVEINGVVVAEWL